MKKILLFIVLFSFILCFSNKANARKAPYSTKSEYINIILDLPNDSTTLVNVNGKEAYANIGCFFKQVWFFWIPLWNYDEQYCVAYEGIKDRYEPITQEQAEKLAEIYNLKLPKAQPSFWNRIGGKLAFLALIGIMIWEITVHRKKKKKEKV